MFIRNYKKTVLSIFTYWLLISTLSSCSWYKFKATEKLLYDPFFKDEKRSEYQDIIILGSENIDNKNTIDYVIHTIKSEAS